MQALGKPLTMAIVSLAFFSVVTTACASAQGASSRSGASSPGGQAGVGGDSPIARHQGEASVPTPDTFNGFTTRTYTDAQGDNITYYLYSPVGAVPGNPGDYPVVLLLIGAGERAQASASAAQNRAKILNDPYVKLWSSATVQQNWPSFVIAPQPVNPSRWVNVPGKQGSYTLASQPSISLALAKEILDQTEREEGPAIDPSRVYITGISMGGYGVWDAIERWPTSFAAAAPISGAGDPSRASAVAGMPIWDFHGSQDTTVPISGSEDMIRAIQAAGGHPKFTIIPSVSHDIWMKAYTYPGFLAWLFAQRAPAS